MKKILGVVKVHEKISIHKDGTKAVFYRIAIPASVLKRLGLSQTKYVAFKREGDDIQIIKATATHAEKTHCSMEHRKIGSKDRIGLPDTVIEFLNIANGDYLKFVELEKNDIRLRKLDV